MSLTTAVPTGVRSSISGSPSLDEMLRGGIRGDCLLAGVTSVGKTTLAVHFLANDDGANHGKGAVLLDYGIKQGHDRYLRAHGVQHSNFDLLIKGDVEKLRESVNALHEKKEIPEHRSLSLNHRLGIIFDRPSLARSRGINPQDLPSISTQPADLSKTLQEKIVKVDMRPEYKIEEIEMYFGKERHKDWLSYETTLMSALLYHASRINGVQRYVIDGVRLKPEQQPRNGREGISTPDTDCIVKTQNLLRLQKYFNGELHLALPFVGTNIQEFFSGREMMYWELEQQPSVLTSLTLTGNSSSENVADIGDAINHTQALAIAQELEGVIVLGKNLKGKYGFVGRSKVSAPPHTRILAICKSRYGADETYREIFLDTETQKPVLGRAMKYIG